MKAADQLIALIDARQLAADLGAATPAGHDCDSTCGKEGGPCPAQSRSLAEGRRDVLAQAFYRKAIALTATDSSGDGEGESKEGDCGGVAAAVAELSKWAKLTDNKYVRR